MENGESPEECAVRETCEELGIGQDSVKVIGQGDTLYGNGNFKCPVHKSGPDGC